MDKKRKILLGTLCVAFLFLIYEIGDWNINRHWVGTTQKTKIVQEYTLPLDKYFPEGDWHFTCGDSLSNYIDVWLDFSLFGDHPTLHSGICWATSDIIVNDNKKYVNTTIIPWLQKQGFSEVIIEGDLNSADFNFREGAEKIVDISEKHKESDNTNDKVKISFYIYSRHNTSSQLPSNGVMIHIHVVYTYVSQQ